MVTATQTLVEEAGRPGFQAEEYKYKDVKWKDFVTKPKYIRASIPKFCGFGLTEVALWVVGIFVTVLTILITIHHDQIVEVYAYL